MLLHLLVNLCKLGIALVISASCEVESEGHSVCQGLFGVLIIPFEVVEESFLVSYVVVFGEVVLNAEGGWIFYLE